MVASTTTSAAFWLGLYATAVATLVALVTLYGEVFLRVRVRADDGYLVPFGGEGLWVRRDSMESMFPSGRAADNAKSRPGTYISIENRGRRAVQIRTLAQRPWFRLHEHVFIGPYSSRDLPATVEPTHTKSIVLTDFERSGGLRRIYVVDGSGRVHPLRERWLQRVENVVRKPILAYRRRRRTKLAQSD